MHNISFKTRENIFEGLVSLVFSQKGTNNRNNWLYVYNLLFGKIKLNSALCKTKNLRQADANY